jgi:hypothetical protein
VIKRGQSHPKTLLTLPFAPWTSVQEELMDQLAKSCSCGKSPRPAHITAEQRSFLDRQVSLLINAGLLSRQARHSWTALSELTASYMVQ